MRRRLQITPIAIGLAVLFALFLAANSNAQKRGPIGEILDRMDKHSKALTSVQAEVTMVKFDATLKVSDIYVGTTSYVPETKKRKISARIDWAKPVVEQMSVDGDKYELYRPKLNQVISGSVRQVAGKQGIGNTLGFMNMSKKQLKLTYGQPVVLGEEQIRDGVKTWHLLLTPLKATSYKSAELWVDTDGMPRQARINQHNNDSTTILLSNVRKNGILKKEIFTLNIPRSAKRVRA